MLSEAKKQFKTSKNFNIELLKITEDDEILIRNSDVNPDMLMLDKDDINFVLRDENLILNVIGIFL